MSRIAWNIGNLSAQDLGVKTQNSLTAIAAAPTVFTGATTVLTEGNLVVGALTAKDALVTSLSVQLAEARQQRDMAYDAVGSYYMNALTSYVSGVADGEASIIVAAAMDVYRGRGPGAIMPKVVKLSLVPGENAGTLLAAWEPVPRRGWYQVEITATPMDAESWEQYINCAKPGVELPGLPSTQRRWLRVRACNYVNDGAWSDPVGCTIP